MPAQQLRRALDGVPDVEQLPDQRPGPAQRPALVAGEPVRQRSFPQLGLQPGPLLRAQPLPRHRALRPQRAGPAIPPRPVPPPHRPFRHPQVMRDLTDRIAAGKPPGGPQPQPLTPQLLSGRIPAPLRIPHIPVIRPRPPGVTTLDSTSSVWLALGPERTLWPRCGAYAHTYDHGAGSPWTAVEPERPGLHSSDLEQPGQRSGISDQTRLISSSSAALIRCRVCIWRSGSHSGGTLHAVR
jgi:hypothetical protein